MVNRGTIALILTLIAYTIGMIAYALATGEIRGRYDWIKFAENPISFRDWFFLHVIGATALIFFLWKLRNRPRA
ncbi:MULTISPECIES: hypothetical protein [Mesorhizobium]|uniref:hypothetical protein n=1 Tax=Mesorhizobium TaxID=68287 RepID=UPI0010A96332|nr:MULTISPECIES: hypothetical protein [Mesorhizobium]